MQISELVKVNEEAILANAVNFGMMEDKEKNLGLCQGFVFNYESINPKASTLGVLEAIQRSYRSRNEVNIHLFVQDYGRGKSHFALVTANYFKQSIESQETQGILEQVRKASINNPGIVEDLEAYKRRNKKHLVICLSGEEMDLRQSFLKAINKTLIEENITDTLAQEFCQQPLNYLKSLEAQQQQIVNNFIENNYPELGDLDNIIESLTKENYRLIPQVKEISKHLNQGFAIDFETDLNIEQILENLLQRSCLGENAPYAGILILFDELNNYLQSWARDAIASGGLTLQNITNICENYKGKIALVCFTQIRPLKSVPNKSADDYKKLASRLEIPESTYEPISSLELVIKGLLVQQSHQPIWAKFIQKWGNTLLINSRQSFEKRISYYRERGWDLQTFHSNITLDSFPLHPLTTYLLCNLDFTQGRTAIQYIKEDVKKFIQNQPLERNNLLNCLPAISLIDAFSDFSQTEFSRYHAEYQKTYQSISFSITTEEESILKAIFLFYISGNKLNKPNNENHAIILSELSGLSETETTETLTKLSQERQVIYYNTGDNTYRFYSGNNLLEIRQQIEEEAERQPQKWTVNLPVKYCQEKIDKYLRSQYIEALNFIEKNKLINGEWYFENKFYTIEEFEQALLGYKTLENTEAKGIFAYILADRIEDLQDLKYRIDDLLSKSQNKHLFAVAIPNKTVGDIPRELFMIDIIRRKNDKQESGTAYNQLRQDLEQKIDREIREILVSCDYYCLYQGKLTAQEEKQPQAIISLLLNELYSFVPPLAKNDKMALKSNPANTIIGYAIKHLIQDELKPQNFPNASYNNLINPVFVSNWGLLKVNNQKYSIQIPSQRNVRQAWDKISELTDLGNKEEKTIKIEDIWKTLSKPPFGYNEYTFTMLFGAWLGYHYHELKISGTFGIPQRKTEQISHDIQPVKKWTETNIFDKPKDFVNKWILGNSKSPQIIKHKPIICPEIPSTLDYNQAKDLVTEIDNFINSGEGQKSKKDEIKIKKSQLLDGIKIIDNNFKIVEEAEELTHDTTIEKLILIYVSLQQELTPKRVINLINYPNSNKVDNSHPIYVSASENQKERQQKARILINDKINEFVDELTQRSEKMKTEQELGRYQGELENTKAKISEVDTLPSHLIDSLNYALNTAKNILKNIQYQEAIKQCLSQIELRYKTLSDNASQKDYQDALLDIENLAEETTVIKQESRYIEIINNIKDRHNYLEQKIQIWQERVNNISKNQAFFLSQEINSLKNRFTDIDSCQKIENLLQQLNPIILEWQNEEEADKIKHQEDENILQELRSKRPSFLKNVTECQDSIVLINNLKEKLNYPDRFNQEIEQLKENLNQYISDCYNQLNNLEVTIQDINNSQELDKFNRELIKLETIWEKSSEYSRCQTLYQDIDNLRSLFKITEYQGNNDLKDYENTLQQLNQWYQNINDISPNIEAKYQFISHQLTSKINTIRQEKYEGAITWLNQLNINYNLLLENSVELSDEKLKIANNLLKEIECNYNQYLDYFGEKEKNIVKEYIEKCIEIQNENTENQIIVLFQQLTIENKQLLHNKLEQYLND
ncbi:hypothetical protein ACN4EE_17600 [Geminocystis sp. CENA526]|uniref:hypothetical protein n=1 Tax=Geminocystis sp. CENA526 TaxID=1355871 RepID=UPI003D6FBA76